MFSPLYSGASSCNWTCALGCGDVARISVLFIIHDGLAEPQKAKTAHNIAFCNIYGSPSQISSAFFFAFKSQISRVSQQSPSWVEFLWLKCDLSLSLHLWYKYIPDIYQNQKYFIDPRWGSCWRYRCSHSRVEIYIRLETWGHSVFSRTKCFSDMI